MWPEDETEGLYNSPDTTEALAWSEDNLLATACGQGAMIMNPADLKGPKASTANQTVDTSHLIMEEVPTNGDSNTLRQLLLVRQPAFLGAMKTTNAVVRQLAWSHGGCSAFGGCMLGVVTNDHRVSSRLRGPMPHNLKARIFARPHARTPNEWHPCKDLTSELRSYMERTGWADADSRQEDANGEPLRLRGGGRSSSKKRTPAQGTDSDDNVPVRLKQAALSAREKVQEVEEVVEEDGETTSTGADVSDIEDDPDISGKPRPRSRAPRGRGSGRATLSKIGRKQQTKPAAAKPAPKNRASKAVPAKAKPAKRVQVKKAAAPASQLSDIGTEAAASDADLEAGDKAAMVLAELATGPSRAAKEGKGVGKRRAAGKGRATGKGKADGQGKAVNEGKPPAAESRKRKRSTTPAAAKAASKKTADEDTNEGKLSPRSSTPCSKQKNQSEYLPAEEYQVPFGFDSSVLQPVSYVDKAEFMRSFADAFLDRWLRLRLEVPEEEVPQYTKGAHMRGPDIRIYEQTRAEMMHVHGSEFQKYKLTEKWMNVECKRVIRTTVINPTMRFNSDASDEEIEVKGEDGSVTKRMATDTQRALRRLEKKRARELQSGNPSTEEEPATPVPKRRRVISPKGPSYAARRAAAAAAAANAVPIDVYERRIQLLQATCVGWSPLTAAGEGASTSSQRQMCMVAVGTRAGRVWLWRYTPPPPTLFPAEDEESKHLELIGSVQTGASWVVSMKWSAEEMQGSLVLCAGHSDGSAAVAAFDAQCLASSSLLEQPGGTLHTALATVLPPDPLGVTSMEVDSSGPGCLSLMVGKHVGGLAVWHGEGLDLSTTAKADASLRRGSRAYLQEAHGTAPVMGTSWLRGLGNGSDGCAASFGIDGEVKYWRCNSRKIEFVARSRLKGLKRDTLVNQPRPNAAFGFCLSGNRILAAAVLETSNSKWQHLMETMTFKRMHRARIHLLQDAFTPDELNDAVLFATERLKKADASPVARLWDITAALHLAHRPEYSEDFVDPPKQVQATDTAVCTAAVTQDLFARLERLCKRVMSTPAVKRTFSERSLFRALDKKDWRGLQVANALRRLLFPLTLIVDKTTRKPVQQTDLSRQWEAQIRLNEFALLQRHILERLRDGARNSGSDSSSLLLMADWVGLFSSQLQPELTPALAAAVYEAHGGSGHKERRAREALPGNCTVEMKEAVHPVAAARWACMQFEGGGSSADMGRCGATLRVIMDDSWHCRLCKRSYSQSALQQGLLAHNLCIYCGIRVGPLLGQEAAALGIQAIAQQQ